VQGKNSVSARGKVAMADQEKEQQTSRSSALLEEMAAGSAFCFWRPIVADLCTLDRCIVQASCRESDVVTLTARILRQWLRLPEPIQRTALQIRHTFVRHGYVYAASLCRLLQHRYSLHQHAVWRQRLVRAVPPPDVSTRLLAGCLVYGSGAVGCLLLRWLQTHGMPVSGFLDAYSKLAMNDGVPVFRPELTDASMRARPVLVSLADDDRSIRLRLLACGYTSVISREELFGCV